MYPMCSGSLTICTDLSLRSFLCVFIISMSMSHDMRYIFMRENARNDSINSHAVFWKEGNDCNPSFYFRLAVLRVTEANVYKSCLQHTFISTLGNKSGEK